MTPTDDNFAQAVKELRGQATSPAKVPEPKEPKPRKPKKSKGKKKVAVAPAAPKSATGQVGLPAEIEEVDEIDEKQLKTLQESLSHLSKKAIRKLKKLLDSDNARVQMQTALGVIRATVQALTRDTSPQGAGAEIHIHTSSQSTVITGPPQAQASGQPQPGQFLPARRTGKPITIVK
ncbi:MAG: hypothetical protein ACOZF2_11380 [Thermodesulfobacteriota bacterium]